MLHDAEVKALRKHGRGKRATQRMLPQFFHDPIDLRLAAEKNLFNDIGERYAVDLGDSKTDDRPFHGLDREQTTIQRRICYVDNIG